MNIPSTKDTIGCAIEPRQPKISRPKGLIIDITSLPQDFDAEYFIEQMKMTGVVMMDSTSKQSITRI